VARTDFIINMTGPNEAYDFSDDEVIKEYERRLLIKSAGGTERFLDKNFPQQNKFIRDQKPFQALLCTRRAGKSYGAALKMLKEAIEWPNSNIGYLALTRFSAKAILWKDCLKAINKKFGLGIRFNETELTATLPEPINTVIYLSGADATDEEMEKFLGRKYRLVVIDEAASFRRDLRDLVFSVLKPAVADYRGIIALIGTPRNVNKGLFYDITNEKTVERGWSKHSWTTFDNPHMRENWEQEIKELIEMNPLIQQTPAFQMNYLGQWVIDDSLRVYKSSEKNLIKHIAWAEDAAFILGVDLGYSPDPSAFVVASTAMKDGRNQLRFHKAFKQKNLIISDVVEVIKSLLKEYGPMRIVMDAADKQAVEEMRQKHGLPIVSAEKHGKAGVIEVMNSDFIMGNIVIDELNARELFEEHRELVWDDRSDKREENAACENHLSDAALYAWRSSFRNHEAETVHKTNPHGQEAIDEWEEIELERVQRIKRGNNEEFTEF
jgi:hypothetical protein